MTARDTRSLLSLWLPVVAYMAAIFWVSSLSKAPLPQGMSDKTGHSLAYFGLGVVVTRAIAGGLPSRVALRSALLALAIAVAYGASDEYHQSFVAGRSADVEDLYADAAGATTAVVACWAWGIISRRSDV